ncbi:GGDEF domain-containing protein [Stenotrophomonas sp. YAU14D1_LEIMI4_1]|uniref:GGDEF domain-containing protein n=1 Tax=Stenotrophomonas sp. YAU14D1_LEIMI4_1 TaxID=2072407 RepID=UPI000D541BBC|nr:GGDEF domain-containing protein [Stenotrophomonas sp. YAU14D1_LEIMI4_1]AWH23810.1 cyclic nucleotide-binding protein [Stenotrophomonas sp. YAU14D1_LEIMI4_1]
MTGRGSAETSDMTSGIATAAMAGMTHAVLSDAEVALFAQFAQPRPLPAGQWLFLRGHPGQSMYVILEGQVELDFGEDLLVKTLGRHEFFGELGLLMGNHARSAGARAMSDCTVLELGPDAFQRLVDADPGLVAQFLRRTIMRVLANEQALISQLRRRNHDLETALDNLYITTHQLTHTRELVRTDELTGLHNRRGLTLYLKESRAHPDGPPQALLLIDCDHFKQINDRHGHQAGDRVLQSMGNILRSMAGEHDLACRLGGDEFCLILRRADREAAQHAAEFILSAVHGLLERGHGTPHVSLASIGVSMLVPEADWSEWYAGADRALYEAKRAGGNCLRWAHGPDGQ